MNLIDAVFTQLVSDDGGGTDFGKTNFRVRVQVFMMPLQCV